MDETTRQRIHKLWDDLAEFEASRNEHALEHLLTVLSSLIDAQQAFWIGTVRMANLYNRDPIGGWRPRIWRNLHPSPELHARDSAMASQIEAGLIDPSIVANLQGVGSYRININHEILPAEWFQSEYYKLFFESLGIRDVIFAVTPLGNEFESWLGFQRIADVPSYFGDKEREILDYAIRPLRWFHHMLALHHGLLLAEQPLTASERRVLNGLLTDRSEQQIANDLKLSQNTVHTYCKRICRKFGVRGRMGLTALWLGTMPLDK